MIPLKDENPSRIIPVVTFALIGINIAAFVWQLSLPRDVMTIVVSEKHGFVPVRVTQALQGEGSLIHNVVIPLFTSMFLHGGLAHLLGNMLFLFVFGDNVEARVGRGFFVVFYLLCGIAASLTHYVLAASGSEVPTIGASGAIAGVLGAYIQVWPKARVITLIPIFYFIRIVPLPAFIVLGLWFVLQFVGGIGSLESGVAGGGVAYWAHIGGFVAGFILMPVFSNRTRTHTRTGKSGSLGR